MIIEFGFVRASWTIYDPNTSLFQKCVYFLLNDYFKIKNILSYFKRSNLSIFENMILNHFKQTGNWKSNYMETII